MSNIIPEIIKKEQKMRGEGEKSFEENLKEFLS